MRSTVLVLCAGVWLASFEPAFGRQTRGVPPPPQFRTSIDIVHMDVSVLDSRRRPVRGLTPADFTILENGKPQPVAMRTEDGEGYRVLVEGAKAIEETAAQ